MAATMTKIIKEMLPPDVRVARDTQDLLIECCVGQNFTIYDNFIFSPYCVYWVNSFVSGF
jgi:hypothetical protein